MKKQELIDIKKMDPKSIAEKIKKTRKEFDGLQIDKNMGKLSNLKAYRLKKRDLAQMLTILRQKELLDQIKDKGEK